MIVVVDYDCGNLGSIKNMLKRIGHESVISSAPYEIQKATKLILPGVGSFDYGMIKLKELGLIDVLNEKVLGEKTPVLGICLGAQLMCSSSEEGKLPGLNWVTGAVVRFPTNVNEKKFMVPHIGWDYVKPVKSSRLFLSLPEETRFYFVHSYCIQCENADDVLASNIYSTKYHAAYEVSNIVGVQFHPEKSHRFGKQLLKNFIENY